MNIEFLRLFIVYHYKVNSKIYKLSLVKILMDAELAEVFGIFAADGSMQDDHLCMWGNINEDREYYDKIVCPLFSKVFSKQIIAHDKKSNSVCGFYLCDRNAINLIKEFGFCKRKTYIVRVPEIIIKSNDLVLFAAFIRGFFDCDGFISFLKRKGNYKPFKTKYHTYPRIAVKIASKNMVEDLSYMLNKLGVEHTKGIQKSKENNLSDIYWIEIRGIERTEKYLIEIGFNNPAQNSKHLVWKKFGFCPPRTSKKQRELILSDKLDPYLFYAHDRI